MVLETSGKDKDSVADFFRSQPPSYILKISEGLLFGLECLLLKLDKEPGYQDFVISILELFMWLKKHVQGKIKRMNEWTPLQQEII